MTEQNDKNQVRFLFDSVANRYDLANHLLSFGLDLYWRKKAVKLAASDDSRKVLDVCCGTGDFAFSFAKNCPKLEKIIACDFSSVMIEIAKVKQRKIPADIEWFVANCISTGFDDSSFDIISCGFGVRNLIDLKAGLTEMHRLLGPGGRTCILEFSMPKNILFRLIYLFYLNIIVPLLGGLITGKYKAYKYLAKTVKHFCETIDLKKELAAAGFREITAKSLTAGIVTIYIGGK